MRAEMDAATRQFVRRRARHRCAFGVVYMAEQREPVRRKVALKILKPGMDTKHVIARFEAEEQALALMDHTNIATAFWTTTQTAAPAGSSACSM